MAKRLALSALLVLALVSPAVAGRSVADAELIPVTSPDPASAAALSQPVPSPQPVSIPVSVPRVSEPTFTVDWSQLTPVYPQGDLLGGYACAPTSLAMVTSFYAQGGEVGKRTAAEFVSNLREGEFVPGQGVPYQKLARQIAELKYRRITGHTGSSRDELRRTLMAGPVIITAGGPVAGGQVSHSLVVTALSDDGSRVKINDAADGRSHIVAWERFDSLWAGGSRGILIISP